MKETKNIFKKLILSCSVFIFIFLLTTTYAKAAPAPPNVSSNGAVILDATTGQVLYSKNGDKQFFPASTTKVLTALVVLENSKLNDKVKIGHNPPGADGTSIGIREGEEYTIEELLYGLLMCSGNDTAEALAEHISGSSDKFAELMNKRAKELGATGSNFANPSGLPNDQHVTTPTDLALIMKECIKNPDFIRITRTINYKLSPSNIDGNQLALYNGNHIIDPGSAQYFYKYAVSSKKGYTTVAHFTNIASAEKDGHPLIVALLDGPGINQAYEDSKNLFEYGFNNYTLKKVVAEGDTIDSFELNDGTKLPLLAAEDVYYCIDNSDKNNLKPEFKFEVPAKITSKSSISRGQSITKCSVKINNKEYNTIDLVSGINLNTDKKNNSSDIISNNKNEIVIICSILGVAFVLRLISVKRRRRKRLRKAKLNQIINKKR